MQEERAMYLETHPTSANSYYTRDLLTLVRPVEDLKAPAYGKAISIPGSFPPSLEETIHWFWVSSVRHGGRAGSADLGKSGWEATMLTGHIKRYTMCSSLPVSQAFLGGAPAFFNHPSPPSPPGNDHLAH